MTLNFCLEIAAFLVGIILWSSCIGHYKITDLKGKIYVHMLGFAIALTGCNLFAYIILRRNVSFMMGVAETIIAISFLMIVWMWIYFNLYLIEMIHGKNHIPMSMAVLIGMPLLVDVILIFANLINHKVFDIAIIDGSAQIVFGSWYWLPYLLAMCSFGIYGYCLIKYRKLLIEKRQQVLFVIPVVLLIAYYLQYCLKEVAVLGFSYVICGLLTYIYSYSRSLKLDSLTRLPDGTTFKQMLDYRIGQKQSMVVAMITLDDFKQVNREFGYHNGNRFLKLIAKYIKKEAPAQCMARYSGDKFAIIFDEEECQEVQEWCECILERFEQSWELGKLRHKLSVCISLVEYPAMADNSEQILDLLEHMNTYGKQNKRNQYIICNDDFKLAMQRRLSIASILNEVVQERKMYVEYQPILNVVENSFTRAEALFRLKDEELGYISPTEFFPIAEENGYIIDIGYILLEQVCQYMNSFTSEDTEAPIISINFFRQQIMDEGVEEKVMNILEKYGIQPQKIAFELPESVFAVQYNKIKAQVLKLHSMGFRFYLDGFGNAFLDMSHLMELPFEVIKINKMMIREAEQNDAMYLLVSAMTAVFEENGKLILGDGIESEHLKEMADLLFMDFLQGHFLCEPKTAEDARIEFLKTDVVADMPDLEDILKEVAVEGDQVDDEF